VSALFTGTSRCTRDRQSQQEWRRRVMLVAGINDPGYSPKKCLAINYDIVIMAAFYEKDVLPFWTWAVGDPADWVRSSGVFYLKSLRFGASNNRAAGCCHSPGSAAQRVRGSAQRVRCATRVFAQPLLQCSECLRSSAVGILLWRTF